MEEEKKKKKREKGAWSTESPTRLPLAKNRSKEESDRVRRLNSGTNRQGKRERGKKRAELEKKERGERKRR